MGINRATERAISSEDQNIQRQFVVIYARLMLCSTESCAAFHLLVLTRCNEVSYLAILDSTSQTTDILAH